MLDDERQLVVVDLPASHFCDIEFLVEREVAHRLLQRDLIIIEDIGWNETMVHARATFEVLFSLQVICFTDEWDWLTWDLSPLVLTRAWAQGDLRGA